MGLVQAKIETAVETSPQLIESLHMAREVALKSDVAQVLPVHLVLAMLEDDESSFLLEAYGVDFKKLRAQLAKMVQKQAQPKTPDQHAVFSPGVEAIMQHAREQAQKNSLGEVDSNLILAVILSEKSSFLEAVLSPYDLDTSGVLQYLELREGKTVNIDPLVSKVEMPTQPAKGPAASAPAKPPPPVPGGARARPPTAIKPAKDLPPAPPAPAMSQQEPAKKPTAPDRVQPGAAQPSQRSNDATGPRAAPRAVPPRPPAAESVPPVNRQDTRPDTPAKLSKAPDPVPPAAPQAFTPPAHPTPSMAPPPAMHQAAARELTGTLKQAQTNMPGGPARPPAMKHAVTTAPAPAVAPEQAAPQDATSQTAQGEPPSKMRSMFGQFSKVLSGKKNAEAASETASRQGQQAKKEQETPTAPPPPAAIAAARPPDQSAPLHNTAPVIPPAPKPEPGPEQDPETDREPDPESDREPKPLPGPATLKASAANNNQSAPLASTNLLTPASVPAPAGARALPPVARVADTPAQSTGGEASNAPGGSVEQLVSQPPPALTPGNDAETAPPATAMQNRPARRRRAAPASLGANECLSATGSVLEKGRLVENVPRRMKINNSSKAEVRITRAQMEEINCEFDDLSASHIHELSVTEAMTVQLRAPGSGFHIENLSPQTQWIDRNQRHINDADFGVWRWNVTPTKSGKERLQLVISARTVDDEGTIHIADIPDKIIELSVNRDHGQIVKRAGLVGLVAVAGIALGRFGEPALAWVAKIAAQIG